MEVKYLRACARVGAQFASQGFQLQALAATTQTRLFGTTQQHVRKTSSGLASCRPSPVHTSLPLMRSSIQFLGMQRSAMSQRWCSSGAVTEQQSTETVKDVRVGSTVVKLKGMPFETSEEQIVELFADVGKPTHIFFGVKQGGDKNGEAFVKFQSIDVAVNALSKNRATIGTRWVEVLMSTEADLQVYVRMAQMRAKNPVQVQRGDFIIKIQGLPWRTNVTQVYEFFTSRAIVPAAISMDIDPTRNTTTGICFVEFQSEADVRQGMTFNKQSVGHRYVELFRVSREKAMEALSRGGVDEPQMIMRIEPAVNKAELKSVLFRGIPFKCTIEDVQAFFNGFTYEPNSLQLRKGADGRPNGQGYVTFSCTEEAHRAFFELNRREMGGRYIELYLWKGLPP